ncbi:MAG: OmpA family protein [Pseudomonadota bacterium]
MRTALFVLCPLLFASGAPGQAQNVPSASAGQVLASGTVPDEASKAAVLARLRELYGADRVMDQIAIGPVAMPANWNSYVQKLLSPALKQIKHGQLKIDGSLVSVRGDVANEAQRQQIASDMASSLNATYTIENGLRVSNAEQGLLDSTLANRIVEFDSGQATLTDNGRAILDEMTVALLKLRERRVDVIGHTDSHGQHVSNQALSLARAQAVKAYLVGKGIGAERLNPSGLGPDHPVASNDTAEGRSRNRRIEFRLAQ